MSIHFHQEKKLHLVTIEKDLPCQVMDPADKLHQLIYTKMQEMYAKSGYEKPWAGYFVMDNNVVIGSCGFKGTPVNNKVEIAYFTFPGYEQKGYASEMCKQLTELALVTDPGITVTAQTLTTHAVSIKILEKNGYAKTGTAMDDEVGEVMEWTYMAARKSSAPGQADISW